MEFSSFMTVPCFLLWPLRVVMTVGPIGYRVSIQVGFLKSRSMVGLGWLGFLLVICFSVKLNWFIWLIADGVVIWGYAFRMRLKRVACCMRRRFTSLVVLSVSGLRSLFFFVDLKATDLLGVLFPLNYLVVHHLTMTFWLQLNSSCSKGKAKLSAYLL